MTQLLIEYFANTFPMNPTYYGITAFFMPHYYGILSVFSGAVSVIVGGKLANYVSNMEKGRVKKN